MKQIIFTILTLFLYSNAYAENSIIQTRHFLGEFLNSAARSLKVGFSENQEVLKDEAEKIGKLNEKAKILKETSDELEINPTILKHGLSGFKPCKYDTHDLVWDSDKKSWKCAKINYSQHCEKNEETGELTKEVANGTVCYKKGTYENVIEGWGVCHDDYGEHYTQPTCIYTDDNATNEKYKSYQVDKSLCEGKPVPQIREQACGINGAESTCKCDKGFIYDYNKGKSRCKASIGIENFYSDMKYGFTNKNILYWGVAGDNYWIANCGIYRRTITFQNYNNIEKMILKKAYFDDYMWIYVNGHRVYRGPYKQGDFIRSLSTSKRGKFLTTNGKRDCELSSSWKKRPNINIAPYLKYGKNVIRMDVEVSGAGEAYTEFEMFFKDKFREVPDCEKRDR